MPLEKTKISASTEILPGKNENPSAQNEIDNVKSSRKKKRHVIATKGISKVAILKNNDSILTSEQDTLEGNSAISVNKPKAAKENISKSSSKELADDEGASSQKLKDNDHNIEGGAIQSYQIQSQGDGDEVEDTHTSNEAQVVSKANFCKSKNGSRKPKSMKKKESTSKKNKTRVRSHVLTDYYPVRRSSRKPKSVLQKEQTDSIIQSIDRKCEDGLSVVEFEGKGRGVVSKRAFKKGSFIVEYAGELIDWTAAKKREMEYAKDSSVGCYMYYFIFENKNYCMDATSESGRLGRLLNHSRKNPNCKTKLVGFPDPDGKGILPRLVIVAKQDISAGEELTYDYGDRDKETLESHPWLKCT